MQLKSLFPILLPLLFITPAQAAEKREALYDVVLDFNRDGVPDRAVLVLVGPGRTDFGELTKERYGLSEDERVELAIYLGGGSAPVDVSKPADITSATVVDPERGDWVMPPEATDKGSLQISNSTGWGATNQTVDTLTLAWRDGVALVAGYTMTWEARESAGTCDVNLLSGKATLQDGPEDAPKKKLKGRFKPVPLSKWSEKTRPKVCDDLG